MGVTQYSIYDANIGYGRKTRKCAIQKDAEAVKKKYHVGYISGVFDLFHIGHLNMFKHAKEQCDYLIVGVVTDEGVRAYKRVEPFVPFDERIEMVRSCRYVDEAVEIPLQYNDTKEAYKLYHFDCQFSGSDYFNDPFWIANKEFLEQNGSEMVFFPYTESTSSSKIKMLIEKRLM
ncbi:MAG: adenylyltransferase/cytidyltransferase family protein [Lachnospiraceae bacterium]